jgi:hypothetical protein
MLKQMTILATAAGLIIALAPAVQAQPGVGAHWKINKGLSLGPDGAELVAPNGFTNVIVSRRRQA